MNEMEPDVIDLLSGIEKGSPLDGLRAQRQAARENAQKSYQALFAPTSLGSVSAKERHAVAAYVAGLHRDAGTLAFYMDGLGAQNASRSVVEAIMAEIAHGAGEGPFGRYREAPSQKRTRPGSSGESPKRIDGLSARVYRQRWSMPTSWSFIPGTRARRRCKSYSTRGGRQRKSSPCRNWSPSYRSRSGSSPACASWLNQPVKPD
jgi:hypothetical protein